jgi:ectoine hydroxylase-related dioxygenase (phytanoyl-CoA dioxygenase family)
MTAQAATAPSDALEPAHRLAPDALAGFERDGHIVVRGVFAPEEIAAHRVAVQRTVTANIDRRHALRDDVEAQDKNWMFVNNLWTQDPGARRFVHSRRLARLAATLLGVDRIRLWRDQSYFKAPGGAGTPWHNDLDFIPLATDDILTAWVPLTDIKGVDSPMNYASGSHKRRDLGFSPGSEAAIRAFETGLRKRGFDIAVYDDMRPGDVAFHHAGTLHASYPHTAADVREAVVIVYFADGARVVHDPPEGEPGAPHPMLRSIREHSRGISLPGIPHGALAESESTPLLYDRGGDAA